MQDGKVNRGVLEFGGFRLHAIQIEMTQRTGCDHDVSAMIFGVASMIGNHSKRVGFIDGENGKSTTAGLARKVHDLGAQDADHAFQRSRARGMFTKLECLSGSLEIKAVKRGCP